MVWDGGSSVRIRSGQSTVGAYSICGGAGVVNCRPAEIGFCSLPGNGDFCRRCETIRRPGYSTDIAVGGRPFIIPIKFAGEEKALKICFGVNVVGAFLIWLIGKEAGRSKNAYDTCDD